MAILSRPECVNSHYDYGQVTPANVAIQKHRSWSTLVPDFWFMASQFVVCWCQAITWTSADFLSVGPSGMHLNEISIKTKRYSFKKIYLNMLSTKLTSTVLFWPQCIMHVNVNSLRPSDVLWYGGTDLCQHWFRQWLVAWQHQAITWTNIDLSSMSSLGFCDILTLHQFRRNLSRLWFLKLVWKIDTYKITSTSLRGQGDSTLRQRQDVRDFTDNIFNYICVNKNVLSFD